MGVLKAYEVMRYIKASAGRAGLGVIWEDENHPRHDGDNIYLPRITTKTTDEQMDELMASTDHEVGHDRYSDFKILETKGIDTSNSVLGVLFNLLEDSRVNNIEAREYEGFRERWDRVIPKLITQIGKQPKNAASELMHAAMKWECRCSADMFPAIYSEALNLETLTAIDDILDTFDERLWACHDELDRVKGSELTYQLAKDIIRALGGDPDKEEGKRNAGKGKAVEPGSGTEPQEGKSDESTEGSGEVPSETRSDSTNESETNQDDEWKIIEVDPKELSKALVTTLRGDKEATMIKVGINHKNNFETSKKLWNIVPPEDVIVVNYVKQRSNHPNTHVLSLIDRSFLYNFKSRIKRSQEPDNFAQQVRRLIQIRAHSRTEFGVKRGKLDQGRIARVCLKDATGFNERIFKRKQINDTLDAAVTVLIDCSGSMSGDKMLNATAAARLLNHVFTVLNLPLELLGFTDIYGMSAPPVMFVFKEFSSPRVSEEVLLERFSSASNFMSGNPDGENILWAYDRLLHRKEKKKLLIVCSDGQPAASRSCAGIEQFTLNTIQEIEKQGKVDIYGLGMLSDSVTELYQHHSVIRDVDEIPTKLLEVIERKLINV